MKEKTFIFWASIIFSIVLICHIARLISGWDINIGGWAMPMWFSGLAIVILGYMVFSGLKLYRKK